ncbi:MAG: phenylalanine--tRNA ligase subunit beta [Candidatus Woesebacteria bacterium]|jgi:phenylalanyl-tRNA synthetase beta chain
MKISLNWLKEYTKVSESVDDLVARIGAQLGAVEEVVDLRGKYDGIKVAQIIEAKPHDNADKLNIYQVTDGLEQTQVVSGDKNLNIGDKVAWLCPGTTVPSTYGTSHPVVMGSREMRGQISHGMFASGKELDINDDDTSVLKLDTDAKPGVLLAKAYGLDDVIIDIENKMFTHRPDCFGLLGVAREVAGIRGKKFESPDWYLQKNGLVLKPAVEVVELKIDNKEPSLCNQYNAAVIRNVKIEPSPIAIQSYLKRVGIRPINNIVDITNYLMYLTGQPLHAFDYDKVAALDDQEHAAIVVRTPKENEEIKLLDGRVVKPGKNTVLICSRRKPLAIGGVMGGANSEIDDSTTSIIIESAAFNMYEIRRTSMELGIFTDAVTRYSKGQSPVQCKVVLAEAVSLITQHYGAQLTTEIGLERPIGTAPVFVNVRMLNQRLGLDLKSQQIKEILENAEIRTYVTGNQIKVFPPFWRTDLEIAEDIVEEVGRLYGYDKLPHSLPERSTEAVESPGIERFLVDVRNILASAGNNELQTYSFVPSRMFQKTDQDSKPAYRLRNALSPELQFVRTSLLPSLLDKIHVNHKAGYDLFGLFEIGKSHNKHEIAKDELPRERLGLSYVFSAEKKAAIGWDGSPYYQAKYQLGYLLGRLNMHDVAYRSLDGAKLEQWWLQNLAKLFEPKRAALVLVDRKIIGVVGEFLPVARKNFKLPEFVSGFELDLTALHGFNRPVSSYKQILRFPSTGQDVCLRVTRDVLCRDVQKILLKAFKNDERLRVSVDVVDIYQRKEDKNHKQITYRIALQHHDRTLTTKEVSDYLAKAVDLAKEKFKAEQV